jgi:hypothetical protein
MQERRRGKHSTRLFFEEERRRVRAEKTAGKETIVGGGHQRA